ncbi:hypothetical protein ATK17_1221 [Branchiibius hedensis]|uniref:DUF985 domain-containing protein n=1 Tax=Branchiibius hedensis TaxID=672460 RepID=A0A2Y8ZQ07_9MICO|nr:cupin domain-containing protein [Branchiibius hedensis]PWJ25109.1 hypothetical protein ATK17_1221 [Branchiibius hedensis]SSA33924.1 hypothetical protein SAMN04489750_1221 [Branchiibius hedensis]
MTSLPDWAHGLDLQPHPEGGWYAETYRSGVTIGDRVTATAIVFLLLPGEESAWHRVRSDELWIHQRGGPLELDLGGSGEHPAYADRTILGSDPSAGHRFQSLVPGGHWQAARPAGDEAVLVACVVTPGFDFADFELAPSPG